MAARNFFITWTDPSNPAMGLDFFPPKGSDELHEALREYYPHLNNLHTRMRAAVIDFYLEQQSIDADLMMQQSPEYLASPNSTSFASSMSTPLTQPIQMQPASPNVADSSSSSVPKQEELMSVWTLPSNPDAKIHKRRNMTDSEKVAYKQKRLEGACSDCKRRRRKCIHTPSSASSVSSQTSGRRKSKQAKRIASQPENIAKAFTDPMPMQFQFDESFIPDTQMEITQLNLELDFMNTVEPSAEIPWDNDFFNTFDFTKDFELYGETSNYNTFLPNPTTTHQPTQLAQPKPKQQLQPQPQAFDIEQFLDLGDHSENNHTPSGNLKNGIRNDLTAQPDTSKHIPNGNRHDKVLQEQGDVLRNPSLLNLEKQSQKISDQILGVGSSFNGAPSFHGSYVDNDHFAEVPTFGGLCQSPVDLFSPSPVEPTVSRSSPVYRSSARRGQQDRRRLTDKDQDQYQQQQQQQQSNPTPDSAMDRMQQKQAKERLQSRTTRETTSATLAIQTPTYNVGEERNRGASILGARSLTSAPISSSANGYTTLTFSIPTATLTSRLCSVIPSLSASASSSPYSESCASGPNLMSQLSPITVSLGVAQHVYPTFNDLMSVITLFCVLLLPLMSYDSSRDETKQAKSRFSIFRQLISNALQFLTISSLALPLASPRKRLPLSPAWLSLNMLLSPLQSGSLKA
jgi:hypothetical protein